MLDRARLLQLYAGDADAVALACMLSELAETWDDLNDGDVQRTPEEIMRAFLIALDGLPRNAFFRRHEAELRPLVLDAVLAWGTSNRLQLEGDRDALEIAHVLRYQGAQLCGHMALLATGDMNAAILASAEIWRMTTKENLEVFVAQPRARLPLRAVLP